MSRRASRPPARPPSTASPRTGSPPSSTSTRPPPRTSVSRGRTGEYGDTSPAGAAAMADGRARVRSARSTPLPPVDAVDRVTKADLGAELRPGRSSRTSASCTCATSTSSRARRSRLREVIDLMPTATEARLARRREPAARAAGRASRASARPCSRAPREDVTPARARSPWSPSRRPQRRRRTASSRRLADGAAFDDGSPLPDALRAELHRAAPEVAAAAYRSLGRFLRARAAAARRRRSTPSAATPTRCTRGGSSARSSTSTRRTSGASRNSRACATSRSAIADRIESGASVARAIEVLDADPARILHGTDALQRWMQETSDASIAAMAGTLLRHPRPDPPPGVPDRPHAGGRHLLHAARPTTSPVPAACGGRCPRASPSSAPGARRPPSTTRASPATTCRSARPSTTAAS